MANVIFDFDGTLADTFPAIIDVAYRLSPRTRRLPPENIDKLRRLPLLTALRQLGIPLRHLPLLILFTRRRLKAHMPEVPPYEGIEAMLKTLHKKQYKLFVLTSNYKENVEIFLRHHKLEKFFTDVQTVPYANTWTKKRALRRLLQQYQLDASETYHVGNEALDMHAARRVGMPGIAVTWGGYDVKTLRSTKPFTLVHTPHELTEVLSRE
jgi:phosphoglycolate phosphatase